MPNSASWIGADHEDHHEHRAEDRVEAGEDVGPDDLAIVRLVRSPVSLVCPRATRSCTSAAVRPVGAVVTSTDVDASAVTVGQESTRTSAISPVSSSSSTR